MKSRWVKIGAWIAIPCSLIAFSSCSDEEILAPSTATLSLVANPPTIPADGQSTATIEAVLQNNSGTPLNGYTIYFTTNLGTITDKADVIDGIARATLTAGTEEGTAVVRAFSGSLSDSVQVLIGFQNVTILLTANPPEIPADGVSTSTIDAFVREQEGLVPDGTNVFFITTLGTITSQVETQEGFASATLTSGIIEGTATVTAIVSNTSQTTTLSIGIPVSNITLNANPSTFEVDTADPQTHESTITVTVWNAAGVPIENKPVVLTSDQGVLTSGGAIQVTNENGQVTDTFQITIAVPQGTSETVRITATSGSISDYIFITIINTG